MASLILVYLPCVGAVLTRWLAGPLPEPAAEGDAVDVELDAHGVGCPAFDLDDGLDVDVSELEPCEGPELHAGRRDRDGPCVEPPRMLVRVGVFGVSMAAIAVVMLNLTMTAPPLRRRARRVLARARMLARRLLRDVFGLVVGGRRLAAAIGLGIVAAFVSIGIGYLLGMAPVLAESVPSTDARYEAMAGAPAWVPPAFFAIYAPAPEELVFRGLLLVAVAVVMASTSNRWVQVSVVVAALVGTSWVFGLVHLHWSLLNAVSAGVTGAIYGAVAHALFNALTFIL